MKKKWNKQTKKENKDFFLSPHSAFVTWHPQYDILYSTKLMQIFFSFSF